MKKSIFTISLFFLLKLTIAIQYTTDPNNIVAGWNLSNTVLNSSQSYSPAEIIRESAINENPFNVVSLLTIMQMEQSLIQQPATQDKLNKATGMGLNDGGFNYDYWGFTPQVISATYQYNKYEDDYKYNFDDAYQKYTTGAGKLEQFKDIYAKYASTMNNILRTNYFTNPKSYGYYNDFSTNITSSQVQQFLNNYGGSLKNENLFGTSTINNNTSTTNTTNEQLIVYKQTDNRWGDLKLGYCKTTIYDEGCAITAISNILSNMYNNSRYTPDKVNSWLKSNKGYDRGCYLYWGRAAQIDGNGGLKYETMEYTSNLSRLAELIDAGKMPIVEVKTPSGGPHFVVVYARDGASTKASSYKIMDSSFSYTTLASYGKFNRIIVYSGANFSNRGGAADFSITSISLLNILRRTYKWEKVITDFSGKQNYKLIAAKDKGTLEKIREITDKTLAELEDEGEYDIWVSDDLKTNQTSESFPVKNYVMVKAYHGGGVSTYSDIRKIETYSKTTTSSNNSTYSSNTPKKTTYTSKPASTSADIQITYAKALALNGSIVALVKLKSNRDVKTKVTFTLKNKKNDKRKEIQSSWIDLKANEEQKEPLGLYLKESWFSTQILEIKVGDVVKDIPLTFNALVLNKSIEAYHTPSEPNFLYHGKSKNIIVELKNELHESISRDIRVVLYDKNKRIINVIYKKENIKISKQEIITLKEEDELTKNVKSNPGTYYIGVQGKKPGTDKWYDLTPADFNKQQITIKEYTSQTSTNSVKLSDYRLDFDAVSPRAEKITVEGVPQGKYLNFTVTDNHFQVEYDKDKQVFTITASKNTDASKDAKLKIETEEGSIEVELYQNGVELNPNDLQQEIEQELDEPYYQDLIDGEGEIVTQKKQPHPILNSEIKITGLYSDNLLKDLEITKQANNLIQDEEVKIEFEIAFENGEAEKTLNVGYYDINQGKIVDIFKLGDITVSKSQEISVEFTIASTINPNQYSIAIYEKVDGKYGLLKSNTFENKQEVTIHEKPKFELKVNGLEYSGAEIMLNNSGTDNLSISIEANKKWNVIDPKISWLSPSANSQLSGNKNGTIYFEATQNFSIKERPESEPVEITVQSGDDQTVIKVKQQGADVEKKIEGLNVNSNEAIVVELDAEADSKQQFKLKLTNVPEADVKLTPQTTKDYKIEVIDSETVKDEFGNIVITQVCEVTALVANTDDKKEVPLKEIGKSIISANGAEALNREIKIFQKGSEYLFELYKDDKTTLLNDGVFTLSKEADAEDVFFIKFKNYEVEDIDLSNVRVLTSGNLIEITDEEPIEENGYMYKKVTIKSNFANISSSIVSYGRIVTHYSKNGLKSEKSLLIKKEAATPVLNILNEKDGSQITELYIDPFSGSISEFYIESNLTDWVCTISKPENLDFLYASAKGELSKIQYIELQKDFIKKTDQDIAKITISSSKGNISKELVIKAKAFDTKLSIKDLSGNLLNILNIGNAYNSTAEFVIDAGFRWKITGETNFFDFEPAYGEPGTYTVTVKALASNVKTDKIEKTIKVVPSLDDKLPNSIGTVEKELKIVQDGAATANTTADLLLISPITIQAEEGDYNDTIFKNEEPYIDFTLFNNKPMSASYNVAVFILDDKGFAKHQLLFFNEDNKIKLAPYEQKNVKSLINDAVLNGMITDLNGKYKLALRYELSTTTVSKSSNNVPTISGVINEREIEIISRPAKILINASASQLMAIKKPFINSDIVVPTLHDYNNMNLSYTFRLFKEGTDDQVATDKDNVFHDLDVEENFIAFAAYTDSLNPDMAGNSQYVKYQGGTFEIESKLLSKSKNMQFAYLEYINSKVHLLTFDDESYSIYQEQDNNWVKINPSSIFPNNSTYNTNNFIVDASDDKDYHFSLISNETLQDAIQNVENPPVAATYKNIATNVIQCDMQYAAGAFYMLYNEEGNLTISKYISGDGNTWESLIEVKDKDGNSLNDVQIEKYASVHVVSDDEIFVAYQTETKVVWLRYINGSWQEIFSKNGLSVPTGEGALRSHPYILKDENASQYYLIFADGGDKVWQAFFDMNNKKKSGVAEGTRPEDTTIVNENKLEISIVPNPVNDILYVKANVELQNVTYSLHSITGTKITEKKLNGYSIDVSNLKAGVYFLTIVAENNKPVQFKLIKK